MGRCIGILSNLWDDVVAIWNTVSDWFRTNVSDPIINLFNNVWTDVSGFFSSLWEDIKSIWESVGTWFQTTIIDPLVSAWQTATESIKGFFDNIWSSIKEGARTAINWVISKLNGFLSGIVGV